MPVHVVMFFVVGLSLIGFALGYRRAWAAGRGSRKNLHSLPVYHGLWVLLCMLLQAQAFVLLGLAVETYVTDWLVWHSLPDSVTVGENRSLVLSRIATIAEGLGMFGEPSEADIAAADYLSTLQAGADWGLALGAVVIALVGSIYALPRIREDKLDSHFH
jgi:phosphate transport system permease protein